MNTKRLTKWLAVIATTIFISACGGGGGGGGGSGDPVVPSIPDLTGGGEGTKENPVPVQVGASRPSRVGFIADSYYSFTAPTTGTYVITLANASSSVEWELFSNKEYSYGGTYQSCSSYSCTIGRLDAGATYYVVATQFGSFSGATFDLQVKLVGSEGTTSAPVNLTVDTAHNGTVGLSESSYYRFNTSTAGAYTVSVTTPNSIARAVNIYSGSFASATLLSCNNWAAFVCTANGLAANSPYYVEVLGGDQSGGSYTITVTQGVSQGSKANPVSLALNAPTNHSGAVDGGGVSYYTFTTAVAGEYLLKFESAQSNLYATLYSDAGFTSTVTDCYATTAECRLTGLSANTQYYIGVRNSNSVDKVFQIGVDRGVTEGTKIEPVALTSYPHSATIAGGATAYYSFVTSAFAGSYTISLLDTQADLKWSLYTASSDFYSAVSQCDTTAQAANEICASSNLQPNTTYHLAVTNNSSSTTSAYKVVVAEGGGSQGTDTQPIDLGVVPASGLEYLTGQVKGRDSWSYSYGQSYYKFTTGPTAAFHVISMLNMQADLEWTLDNKPGNYSGLKTCNDPLASATAEVCSTDMVLAANTVYYLRVTNNSATGSTFSLNIKPLLPAAGCTGSYSQCINFESTPPAFAQESTQQGTKWQWRLDSSTSAGQPGSGSYVSGTVDYPYSACFSYTPAVRPTAVSMSFLTQDVWVDMSVYENGNRIASASESTSGASWERNTYPLPAGTLPLTFKWCLSRNSTFGTPMVRIDDIQFH